MGLIVEFELFKEDAEDDQEQQSFMLDVEQKFVSAMDTMTSFMGATVMNAVVSGKEVETPFALAQAASGNDDAFAFIFGDQDGEADENAEPEFVTKIAHISTVTVRGDGDESGGGIAITYGLLIGVFVTMLAILVICICLYGKWHSTKDKVVKEVLEQTELEKSMVSHGRGSSFSVEKQYNPDKESTGEFGGTSFHSAVTLDERASTLQSLKARHPHKRSLSRSSWDSSVMESQENITMTDMYKSNSKLQAVVGDLALTQDNPFDNRELTPVAEKERSTPLKKREGCKTP